MPTVIDALLVTLGYETSGLRRGTVEAGQSLATVEKRSDAVSKAMVRHTSQIADGYKKVRNEALAMLAVFLGGKGLKDFFTDAIANTSGLSRMSANLDMSAKSLAQWQLANRNAGGTVAGMTAQLQQSQTVMARLKRGDIDPTVEAYYRNRLPGQNPAEDLKDAESFFRARSKIIAKAYAESPAKAADIASQLGIGDDVFNLAKQGPEAMDELRDKFEGAAAAQGAMGDAAERLRQRMDALWTNLEANGLRVLEALMPSIDLVFKKFEQFGDWVADHGPEINRWVTQLADGVGDLARKIGDLMGLGDLGELGDRLATFVTGKDAKGNELPKFDITSPIDSAKDMLSFYTGGSEWKVSAQKKKELVQRQALLTAKERKYGLPTGLLDAQWDRESGRGSGDMVSPKGATGHFQFMPATAKEYGMTREDTFDFDKSSEAAAKKMRRLIDYYKGDNRLALMAYNGGEGNLAKRGPSGMPLESVLYATDIIRRIGPPAAAAASLPTPPVTAAPPPPRAAAGNSTTSRSSEVHIQSLVVQSQATDATGIARDIKSELSAQLSDRGLD